MLIKKSAIAYVCPDRQMEKCEEAAPRPPELDNKKRHKTWIQVCVLVIPVTIIFF
ncbi:hypothetical protein [Psychrobacillus sp. MER TA 171]|uniref:hypothetical protein n=1 Tax=Psychrobacillus sp. MER TA 171 TaxID=2939577 RepID=UPI00203A7D91|nr:hypothetical protein [Psychrobacillus sp. MER TA 171]MCM3358893.1 hypothetical protein [Psychrobacillus sp. MER TA 171]